MLACLPAFMLSVAEASFAISPIPLTGTERGSAETLAPLPVVGSVNGRPSHSTAIPRAQTGSDLSSLCPWLTLGGGSTLEGEWRWRNHCWPVLSSRIPNVVCITVRELICGDLSCSHTFTYHLYTADTQICISSPHCFLEGQKQHLVFQLASQFIKWAKLGGQQVPGIHPSLPSQLWDYKCTSPY